MHLAAKGNDVVHMPIFVRGACSNLTIGAPEKFRSSGWAVRSGAAPPSRLSVRHPPPAVVEIRSRPDRYRLQRDAPLQRKPDVLIDLPVDRTDNVNRVLASQLLFFGVATDARQIGKRFE